MSKKKNLQEEELNFKKMQDEVEKVLKTTLDELRLFGKKEVKSYPEKLKEMGVFQDEIFASFLYSFTDCVQKIGSETAESERQIRPETLKRFQYLSENSFNQLIGVSTMTLFMNGNHITFEEMTRLREYLNNKVVVSFLYQFADTIITLEMAHKI